MATEDVMSPEQVANRLLNAELLRAEAAMHRAELDEQADWYEQRKQRATHLRREAEALLSTAIDNLARHPDVKMGQSLSSITFEDSAYRQLLDWAAEHSTIPVEEQE